MRFSIGEIAIFISFYAETEFEVEIVSNYIESKTVTDAIHGNEVIVSGYEYKSEQVAEYLGEEKGIVYFAPLKYLRKKQPPQELGSWEVINEIMNPSTVDA